MEGVLRLEKKIVTDEAEDMHLVPGGDEHEKVWNMPFPNEILFKILSYLNLEDLDLCSQVSKRVRKICQNQKVWQEEFHERMKPQKLSLEMGNSQKTHCFNVPQWFVEEGGEMCLSDTKNGLSIIYYWPKFFCERESISMFQQLRKSCKWQQKQVRICTKCKTRLKRLSVPKAAMRIC